MEEFVNLSHDDVLEIINDFPIDLIRNKVIITMNQQESEEDDLSSFGTPNLSDVQYILAVGNQVKSLHEGLVPGAKVLLDVTKMGTEVAPGSGKYKMNVNPIEVGDYIFQLIPDNFIIGIDKR